MNSTKAAPSRPTLTSLSKLQSAQVFYSADWNSARCAYAPLVQIKVVAKTGQHEEMECRFDAYFAEKDAAVAMAQELALAMLDLYHRNGVGQEFTTQTAFILTQPKGI
jgi:hypothetical protein